MSALEKWGYAPSVELAPGAIPARIAGTWGDYYRIITDSGNGLARKKTAAFRNRPDAEIPTTGDFAEVIWNPNGESRILRTLPRKSVFTRAYPVSSGRKPQTIAVNFDALLFLMSLNQNFSLRRMERFLALGSASGAPVKVVLTKSDLVSPAEAAELAAAARACSGGAEVICISSRTGAGMETLAPLLRPAATIALVGSSGVGKSSLINAWAGEEIMPTLEIREWDAKGRHTTTERELVMLPCGTMVLDTPGMREIALWEADAGVSETFPEIEELAARCRFSDCRHETEPGCAIKAALESGGLAPARWQAYLRLKNEAAAEATSVRARRQSGHRFRK